MNDHQIQPEQYQSQLAIKQLATTEQFARFNPPPLETFDSPISHYRMRAEFKIWHVEDTYHYAMQPKGDKKAPPILMRDFPVASETINTVMPPLLDYLNQIEELKRRLFQVEFLSTTTKEILITLVYHRPLDEQWQLQANQLQENLNKSLSSVIADLNIIGRSRKQKIQLGKNSVTETMVIDHSKFQYQQVENSFTQPNAAVCVKMLAWASDCAKDLRADLLELYCGNGNFTIPLSHHFDKVFATEISKTSVASAKHNINLNKRTNITVARLSSEEFTQAYNQVRPFRRLRDIDLTSYNFSTVFVDPPRAGLDDDTCELVSNFDNIIYISCNPETLADNLEQLTKTHMIKRLALFDQFPYTDHRECGVLLSKL